MGQQASAPKPGTKIQVIGAGLPRTGTASLSAALNILLDGPVYHCGTQVTMGPPEEIHSWLQILRSWHSDNQDDKKTLLTLLEHRLDGYAAITDSPGSHFVPELQQLYPEAKVVCTERDPLTWEQSLDNVNAMTSMGPLRAILLPLPGMRHFVDYIWLLKRQWDVIYGEPSPNGRTYGKHVAWLKQVVPEDRLVFFNVKDGWVPLCQALGKQVPKDVPFPHVNDSEAIDRTAKYHLQRGLIRWAGIILAMGIVITGVVARLRNIALCI